MGLLQRLGSLDDLAGSRLRRPPRAQPAPLPPRTPGLVERYAASGLPPLGDADVRPLLDAVLRELVALRAEVEQLRRERRRR